MHVSTLPLEGVAKHWQTPCYRTGNAQELECRKATLHVPPLFLRRRPRHPMGACPLVLVGADLRRLSPYDLVLFPGG